MTAERFWTTFVLGAGASIPYGFPSGNGLLWKIIDELGNSSSQSLKILRKIGFDDEITTHFRECLHKSAQTSIDALLEYRTEFMSIGKAAIACALIPLEQENVLFQRASNWYQYVFNRVGPRLNLGRESQIGFITFNYDRSLEHFLHRAVSTTLGCDLGETTEIVQSVPIIHVHGVLGSLPWQGRPAESRDYVMDVTTGSVNIASASIQVMTEARESSPAFQQARALLKRSARIVFLGFGYHRANVARLGLGEIDPNPLLLGSACGMTEHEQNAAQSLFTNLVKFGNTGWETLPYIRNCITLGD